MLSIFACALFSSCRDSIDLTTGNESAKLVLEANITAGETFKEAKLSTSVIINSMNQQFFYPDDAIIKIKEEGKAYQEYSFGSDDCYSENSLLIEPGKTYEIAAEWPSQDFEEVFSSVTVPNGVLVEEMDILSVDTLLTNASDPSLYTSTYVVELKIGEPETFPTYFRILPARTDWIWFGTEPSIRSTDPIFFKDFTFLSGGNALHELEHIEGILIDPSKLESNKIIMSFTTEELDFDVNIVEHLLFFCQSVNIDFYRYHLSKSRQIKAASGSFNQPVTSYTNINNGLGVFSAISETVDSVRIEE